MSQHIFVGQSQAARQVKHILQVFKIFDHLFLNADEGNRIRSSIEFGHSIKPVPVRRLDMRDTSHRLPGSESNLLIRGRQRLRQAICLLEMAECLRLAIVPFVVMSRQPTSQAAPEAAHESGDWMADKKEHTIFARNIPQFGAVIMQDNTVAIGPSASAMAVPPVLRMCRK